MALLGANFGLVAQGLGAYGGRVEQPEEIVPSLRRAIARAEEGQAALAELMNKPVRTPDLPDDWSP